MNGALLIDKPEGISSFGVIEGLQDALRSRGLKKKEMPVLGHGGTLDPFATGLLVVCVGSGVKLSRYFLGSPKAYSAVIRFGETSVSGDCTDPVVETSPHLPKDFAEMQKWARLLTLQGYLQTPPMHSAKKRDGVPLYELARQNIEVEREPVNCQLYDFDVLSYKPPRAEIFVRCSSGTYIRTLAQDFARLLGTVGMLETLRRTQAGGFKLSDAISYPELLEFTSTSQSTPLWNQLAAWVPFDQMLAFMPTTEATPAEALELSQGKQAGLPFIVSRAANPEHSERVAIFSRGHLFGVAKKTAAHPVPTWVLERIFSPEV